jgi:citronellyl-CoA synthetase
LANQEKDTSLISTKDIFLALLRLFTVRAGSTLRGIRGFLSINRKSLNWGKLLEATAEKFPDNAAVKAPEGELTWREYNRAVNRYANYFIEKGLKKGDVAVVFLETRPELLIAYSAMAKIGAVNSMINTNLRGNALLHAMTLNPGKVFIIGEELMGPFAEIKDDLELDEDQEIYFVPDSGDMPCPEGMIDLTEATRDAPADNPDTVKDVLPTDTISYVFTSGTTGGLPKAAVIKHARVVSSTFFNGMVVMEMKPADTMYVPLPFFHTNALALSWPTVFAAGSAVAVRRKFSASRFWDDVRKYDATAFCYVGEVCRYLMNQPPRPDDADNPMKMVIGNGMRPDIWKEFKARFGVDKVFEIYGAAESNLYFVNMFNFDCTVGSSIIPYAIVRYDIEEDRPILDENGRMQRVKPGEAGLALSKISKIFPFSGYTSKKATESKIMRDVFEDGDAWFNTGDLLLDMGHKHAQFVDRLGDTFRWKGENVSTTEVEEVANTYPQVSESTVYGVLMPGGDGRAGMAAVATEVDAGEFDFRGLAGLFTKSLPPYAVPRFIRLKSEFDTTATFKSIKFKLKKEGFDPAKVGDPIYVLLPGEDEYKPLTGELYQEIMEGNFRF